MRAPSNRSGLPAIPIVLLLGVILFLGLALAPRAFEFRAWPEPPRQGAIEEIVDRPADQVIEVPVARVDARKRSRGGDALAVRGRKARKRPALGARSGRGAAPGSRGSRSGAGGGSAPGVPPVVVEEPPAQPQAPVLPPEMPAQLAEGPNEVLRPDAEELPAAPQPEPLRDVAPGPRD